MQPNGASDPTTAAERMLEVWALLASWIAEGAIGGSSKQSQEWVLGALCARGHHAGAMPCPHELGLPRLGAALLEGLAELRIQDGMTPLR